MIYKLSNEIPVPRGPLLREGKVDHPFLSETCSTADGRLGEKREGGRDGS